MDDISSLKKKNEILQQQNLELAEHVQHWKSEYARVESEKVNLLRENIMYKQQITKFKTIEDRVKQNLKNSLTDFTTGTNYIRQIIDTLDGQEIDIWSKISSPQPFRSPLRTNALNVNAVHPMVQGYTIRKPVIRISRTSLNSILRHQDNSSNLTNTAEEESHQTQPVLDYPSLDVYVSLSRIDGPNGYYSRGNSNSDSNQEHNSSHQSAVIEDSASQGSENLNQNSNCSEENEGSAHLVTGETLEYQSRLECILEEDETDPVNWVNSRRRLNPYVVLDNTLDVDIKTSPGNSSLSRTSTKDIHQTLNDDPMEGTSWHFNDALVNKHSRSKPPSKMRDVPIEVITSNNSIDSSQAPDSATNTASSRKSSQGQDQSLGKSFPSILEFHSTPVATKEADQKENITPTNNKFSTWENSNELKVVISKMTSDLLPRKPSSAKSKKVKRSSKNPSESDTTPRKKCKIKKNSLQVGEDSSVLFQTSCENSQEMANHRPRRGEAKNYKEKPLNKKMRRSK